MPVRVRDPDIEKDNARRNLWESGHELIWENGRKRIPGKPEIHRAKPNFRNRSSRLKKPKRRDR